MLCAHCRYPFRPRNTQQKYCRPACQVAGKSAQKRAYDARQKENGTPGHRASKVKEDARESRYADIVRSRMRRMYIEGVCPNLIGTIRVPWAPGDEPHPLPD